MADRRRRSHRPRRRGRGLEWAQDLLTDLLTDATVPISNRDAVRASEHTRYLLIAAGEVPEEQKAAADVATAAPDRLETWTVTGSGHTDGLATRPQEWERRVVAFLDDQLGTGNPPRS